LSRLTLIVYVNTVFLHCHSVEDYILYAGHITIREKTPPLNDTRRNTKPEVGVTRELDYFRLSKKDIITQKIVKLSRHDTKNNDRLTTIERAIKDKRPRKALVIVSRSTWLRDNVYVRTN